MFPLLVVEDDSKKVCTPGSKECKLNNPISKLKPFGRVLVKTSGGFVIPALVGLMGWHWCFYWGMRGMERGGTGLKGRQVFKALWVRLTWAYLVLVVGVWFGVCVAVVKSGVKKIL